MEYDFAIKRNHNFKERFNLLITLVFINQNYIHHHYIYYTPHLKFYSPSLVYPAAFLGFFNPPSWANYGKVLPSAKIWGYELCKYPVTVHTTYIFPLFHFTLGTIRHGLKKFDLCDLWSWDRYFFCYCKIRKYLPWYISVKASLV